jgi:hypothetical protein
MKSRVRNKEYGIESQEQWAWNQESVIRSHKS